MALLFRAEDAAHDKATEALFAGRNAAGMRPVALAVQLVWVALLLAGTLKLGFLTGSYHQLSVPIASASEFQALLDRLVPCDTGKGEEGLSVRGVTLTPGAALRT